MRMPLVIVCLLALFACVPFIIDGKAIATKLSTQQGGGLTAQTRTAWISEVEAYARGLDQYFKRRPNERRFFVDSSPEGQAGWYELKSEAELTNAESGYARQSVIVASKAGKVMIASIGEPREHSRHDDVYYFRGDGTLAMIASSFNSNVGNARYLRKIFYGAESSSPLSYKTVCYEIYPKQKKTSCNRGYVSEQLKDHRIAVYRTNRELPVYPLLKKP
jgi:hypothetical protein